VHIVVAKCFATENNKLFLWDEISLGPPSFGLHLDSSEYDADGFNGKIVNTKQNYVAIDWRESRVQGQYH
jgi:hypothetical protein